MSQFASISEAWGQPSWATASPSATPRQWGAETASPVNEGIPSSVSGKEIVAIRGAETDLYVKNYMASVYREKGVAGVCRILGARVCRSIRNRYMLKLNSDDVLVLLLLVLAGAFAMRVFKT